MREDNAARADRRERLAVFDDARADGCSRIVTCAADDRRPRAEPALSRKCFVHSACNIWRFVHFGKHCFVDIEDPQEFL